MKETVSYRPLQLLSQQEELFNWR